MFLTIPTIMTWARIVAIPFIAGVFYLPDATLPQADKNLVATVLFVLKALMEQPMAGARGCAMAFGPGLTAETMLFRHAG